ncbi:MULTISPECIES: amidohydrolase family protein [unclassified Streptomyces]|jgi:predicted TIM-barrel fold metal-dependent hydrolase|uniref:amidohydrolase family protein n=1 Tax=unclassified Streptomyces TaxID=2593676 RepID=UPI00088087AD|nr:MULTISPECIES: amidohydrolase family protein [unclassified Streptomyces]MDX2729176.1 amidohydrolase family protein [Streptomyces sp. PA03-2a]SCY32352.1 Predicted metal-dependent hydrolase, TIM-barrel fold [Streptomyces sp. 136MFCol5.1]SFS80468.1 Predicted metal-dependent hydrolase, TIM-barrel fold [Streptomyces sp. ok210]
MSRERYTVISADCHAGADLLDYKPYLEARYHEDFDAWAAAYVNPYADLLADTADRNWNSARRLAELAADGIVAEVVFPNTVPPFFPSASLMAPAPSPQEYEQRWAGLRAHNRWLADFCADAPGRRAGVAQILLNDPAEAVREVHRTKEAGLTGGILLPGTPPGSGIPELYSQVYDPLWAVCEELDVPVNHHGGSASPPLGDEPAARAVFMVETTWFSHRALWHLIFGGAFRRHPGLKLVLTEQGSGWIPGVVEMLDYYHGRLVAAASRASTAESKFGAGLAASMGASPGEVWRDNCFVGASFMRPHEVPLRDRIGLDKIMWGSDYPHDEGTAPYSREGLRIAYAGLPPDEIAAMVGGNAARVYGFDLAVLDRIAATAGPTVDEIAEPLKEAPADATSPAFAPGGSVRVW